MKYLKKNCDLPCSRMGTVWLLHLKANARVRHLLHTSTMASGLCHLCTNFVEGQSYFFWDMLWFCNAIFSLYSLMLKPAFHLLFKFVSCAECKSHLTPIFWTLIVLGWSVSHWKFGTYLWNIPILTLLWDSA